MSYKVYLFALLCVISQALIAQSSFWGIRAGLQGASSTLSDDKFDAANGFNKKGGNFAFGLTYARIKTGSVGWKGFITGLTYRQINIISKTSSTNFQFRWIEIPAEINGTANIFGFIPIGLQIGAFGAIPFQYKGAVARYQQSDYVYGNEKYEKAYFILGFRGGISTSIRIKGRFIASFFANYSFGLVPVGPAPPDGVDRLYDRPLPTFADFGLSFLVGKEKLDKP